MNITDLLIFADFSLIRSFFTDLSWFLGSHFSLAEPEIADYPSPASFLLDKIVHLTHKHETYIGW